VGTVGTGQPLVGMAIEPWACASLPVGGLWGWRGSRPRKQPQWWSVRWAPQATRWRVPWFFWTLHRPRN